MKGEGNENFFYSCSSLFFGNLFIFFLKSFFFDILSGIYLSSSRRKNTRKKLLWSICENEDTSKEQAEAIAIKCGMKVNKGKGNISRFSEIAQLSNAYLGKFLRKLLENNYPNSVYIDIANFLLQSREFEYIKDVLEKIEMKNQPAHQELLSALFAVKKYKFREWYFDRS